jgi:hypothetical protein
MSTDSAEREASAAGLLASENNALQEPWNTEREMPLATL